jgi:hypothetical protein
MDLIRNKAGRHVGMDVLDLQFGRWDSHVARMQQLV